MLSPRGADRDEVEAYSSGARASVFKADGSGFIYYPSGRVAVYKGILDGRGRYYLYGDDPRSTPLGAVDEHAVGFVIGPGGVRLALNKVGGLLTDRQGYIEREWRYDLGAHMPPPTVVLEIDLNRSLNFEFHDRGDMRIKFSHEGISHELNAGLRPKRDGTYLDHSVRLPGGRIEPRLDRISLVSRQQSFGDTMKAKRDRLKPRSRNLEGACKDLVAGLEQGFDLMGPKVEPFPDPAWKKDAQAATVYELPRIRSTGLELGPTRGLGDTIYSEDDRDPMHRSASWGGGAGDNAARAGTAGGGGGGGGGEAYAEVSRLRKDGKWLGELDVRRQLFADNPLLQRSTALQAASGRYGEEIVVPGGRVSVSNPTGKVVTSGAPLRRVPASRLGGFLEEEASPDQLVAVVCVRGDDSTCNQVQQAAELANSFLLQRSGFSTDGGGGGGGGGDSSSSSSSTQQAAWASVTTPPTESGGAASTPPHPQGNESYQIVRVDFGEHQGTADRYGVRSLPAFLMFQGGRLAWSGTLGGRPVKAAPPEAAASGRRVLLVEPCAKAQIAAERTMRKFGCSWDLVLNASQALSRMQTQQAARASSMASRTAAEDRGGGYGVLMISDSTGAAEVLAMEKAFRGVGGQRDEHGRVIVGLAAVHGDASCLPSEVLKVVSAGFTDDSDIKRAVLTPQLSLVADLAATKPLRASALKAIFRHCSRRRSSCGGGIAGEKGGGGARSSAAAAALGCSALSGGDARYKGVTPSRLLDKMEAVKAQAAMGIFAAAPRGAGAAGAAREGQQGSYPGGVSSLKTAEILVSAQETDYRGHILGKSALNTALRT